METKKRRPWRRWVVLALMILGWILGSIFIPLQPTISVKAENLLGEGVAWFKLPIIGNFFLVNTVPTTIFTVLLIIVLAYFTGRSLRKAHRLTWSRMGLVI